MEFIFALAVKLAAFALSVLVSFFVLRHLDRRLGVNFRTVIGTINEDPMAAAVYFGARLLSVAIIGAAFLG